MFDTCSTEARSDLLERIRRFFFYNGHDLALAALQLGGATAEKRVTSCAKRLATARRVDQHIRRELKAIHRLLSLENVGDPDNIETALFSNLDPASAEVETICLLMDMLDDLLQELDAAADGKSHSLQRRASVAA
tara:strand:+ start:674 stop:1078 length:405 start_codon:yes stop_codon:yes gene_type:complete